MTQQRLDRFPEVFVQPYDSVRLGGNFSTMTALFREGCYLDDVLDMALSTRSQENDTQFRVMTVGASIGAETDSIGAYITERWSDIGSVALIGLDVNRNALAQAAHARYRTNRLSTQNTSLPSSMERTPLGAGYLIDATKVREKHMVQFMFANLLDAPSDIPNADVIFCNNVLFHMKPEKAALLVGRMVSYLTVNGIMSLGGGSENIKMHHEPAGATYFSWRDSLQKMLAEHHVEPVLFDRRSKTPFAFRRRTA